MDRVAPDQLAESILSAPAWVRLGIAAPGERLRRHAALELARAIIGEDRPDDHDQLSLDLWDGNHAVAARTASLLPAIGRGKQSQGNADKC